LWHICCLWLARAVVATICGTNLALLTRAGRQRPLSPSLSSRLDVETCSSAPPFTVLVSVRALTLNANALRARLRFRLRARMLLCISRALRAVRALGWRQLDERRECFVVHTMERRHLQHTHGSAAIVSEKVERALMQWECVRSAAIVSEKSALNGVGACALVT
jgi:hypothetical protein